MATRTARSAVVPTPRIGSHHQLAAATTRVRKNGIEFQTAEPIAAWTEMTVSLRDPKDGQEISATGVVVDCRGDRHHGYRSSMVFMELTPTAEARLSQMAYSNLA